MRVVFVGAGGRVKNPLTGAIGAARIMKALRAGALVSATHSAIPGWTHIRVGPEVVTGCRDSDAAEYQSPVCSPKASCQFP